MFIQIDDTSLRGDLVRFLRERDYLAIEEAGQVVAVPLESVDKHADRMRAERDLEAWRGDHPGVRVEIVAD